MVSPGDDVHELEAPEHLRRQVGAPSHEGIANLRHALKDHHYFCLQHLQALQQGTDM